MMVRRSSFGRPVIVAVRSDYRYFLELHLYD